VRRIAEFVVRFDVFLLAVVLALTAFFFARMSHLEIDDAVESMFLEDDPDLRTYREFLRYFTTDEFSLIAIKVDDALSEQTLGMVDRITKRLEQIEGVRRVVSLTNTNDIAGTPEGISIGRMVPSIVLNDVQRKRTWERIERNPLVLNNLVAPSGRAVAVFAEIESVSKDRLYRRRITESIHEIMAQEIPKGTQAFAAGPPIIDTVYRNYVVDNLRTLMPIGTLVLIITTLLIYRNARSVVLPAASVIMALIWTMGSIPLLGFTVNLVTTIIPPLLLVIGVAVVIHLLNQFNEELRSKPNPKAAMVDALEHIIKPCFLTSFTTAIGFSSLSLSKIRPVRETGILCALGVMIAFFVGIIFSSFVLARLKPPKRELSRPFDRGYLSSFLSAVGKIDVRLPALVLAVSALVALVAVFGISKIKVETNLIHYFPEESEIYQSYDFLEENIGGASSLEIFIKGPRGNSAIRPGALRAMEKVQKFLARHPKVTATSSVADYVKILNRAFHGDEQGHFAIPDDPRQIAQLLFLMETSDASSDLESLVTGDVERGDYSIARISVRVATMSSSELRAFLADVQDFCDRVFPSDFDVEPAGSLVLYAHMEKALVEGQLKSFALALVVIIFVIMLVFGSWRAGVYSFAPNVIPIMVTVGFMGISGIPINLATCMMPSIAIGIAVDDTIHFLARFRREYRKNRDPRASSEITLATTGRAIVVTSIILFFGFLVVVFSDFKPNYYFGILTALTMVWALLGDLFTLPSSFICFPPKKL